jgi:hypothetical protein
MGVQTKQRLEWRSGGLKVRMGKFTEHGHIDRPRGRIYGYHIPHAIQPIVLSVKFEARECRACGKIAGPR